MSGGPDWQRVTLKDVCAAVQYGFTASASAAVEGPKFLRITDVASTSLTWDDVPHCSIGAVDEAKYLLHDGDIVVARTGATVGYAKFISLPPRAIFASYLVRFRAMAGVDPKFLGAIVEGSGYKTWVKAHAGGSAQPNANARTLGAFPLLLPPIDEQRRIASILSAYDDLIEVNRRRVAILEEMARRLFEEWFVHLRFPGHEAVPVRDEPAGPRPDGWVSGVVGDLLTLHRGYDLASNDRSLGDVPIMTGSGRNGTHNAYKIAAPGVVTGRSGTIGPVFLVHENFWPLNTALYVSSFTSVGPTFALFLLRQLDLRTRAGGAAVPTLNRNHVHALPALRPPVAVVEMYERLAAPMLQQAWSLAQQSERLADARDLLLPRLVSGELSVASAPERLLEAAD